MKLLLSTLRLGISLLTGVVLLIHFPVILCAAIWLFLGETFAARLMAVFAILLWAGTFYLRKTMYQTDRKALRKALLFYFSALIPFVIAWNISSDGRTPSESSFQSHFPSGHLYERTSIAHLVPEIDQVKLGTYLAAWLDPMMGEERAERVRNLSLEVYRELEKDSGFSSAGSVMNEVYRDVLGQRSPLHHLYTYLPSTPVTGKRPVLLFLHGSMGNFKGHLWVLKEFADKTGMAIVAPSFGAGVWSRPGGIKAIENALSFIEMNNTLDSGNMILAGLSNGGLGVTRAVLDFPKKFKAVIYISGVMESEQTTSENFKKAISELPLMIIYGESDERIPAESIRAIMGNLRKSGIALTEKSYPGEDHFLFYARRREITEEMIRFTHGIRKAGIQP